MSPFFKSCSDVQHRQISPTCLVDSLGPGFNLVNIVQWHRFQLIQGKGGAKNGTPSFVLDSVFVKTTYFYYSYTLAFDTLYSLNHGWCMVEWYQYCVCVSLAQCTVN